MKKFIIAFALLIGVASFNNQLEAQNISVNINIGRQPAWGPVGYDYAGYYYFPDIDCYYDVNMGMFYYFDRGRWVSARYLPYAYRNYDLYRLYKVVLNVSEPWRYHHDHYNTYARYRGHNTNQVIIRDSRDNRYRDSRRNAVVWFSKDKSQRDYKYNYNNNRNNARPAKVQSNSNRQDNNRPARVQNNNNNRQNSNKSKTNVRPAVKPSNNSKTSVRTPSKSSTRQASAERTRRR